MTRAIVHLMHEHRGLSGIACAVAGKGVRTTYKHTETLSQVTCWACLCTRAAVMAACAEARDIEANRESYARQLALVAKRRRALTVTQRQRRAEKKGPA